MVNKNIKVYKEILCLVIKSSDIAGPGMMVGPTKGMIDLDKVLQKCWTYG